MQRLDGVRALAVMLVLGEHFWWHTTLWLGAEGVMLFFVLSGFLSTSILLDYSDELSVGEAARVFYLKRLLRLTPVYYTCIAVTVALGIGGTRHTWWVDALYLTNFRVVLRQSWGPDTHFWTLALEEQFYLLWLPIVMLLPRRLLFGCDPFPFGHRACFPLGHGFRFAGRFRDSSSTWISGFFGHWRTVGLYQSVLQRSSGMARVQAVADAAVIAADRRDRDVADRECLFIRCLQPAVRMFSQRRGGVSTRLAT